MDALPVPQVNELASRKHRTDPLVFVLWGDHFDEVMATTFVSVLRREGLDVRIIGLQGRAARGSNAITLHVDMTLAEALPLAGQAVCAVIPCHSPQIGRIDNDPRVRLLFKKIGRNSGQFVTGLLAEDDLDILPPGFTETGIQINEQQAKAAAELVAGHLSDPSM